MLSTIRQAYDRHCTRQRCIQLCQQLLEFTGHLQQHRNHTLAIMAGESHLQSRLLQTKQAILRDLQSVQDHRSDLLGEDQWQEICAEWFTANHQWKRPSSLETFELHTGLIQKVLQIFKEFLGSPLFADLEAPFEKIATLALRDLPDLWETTAQIRAIGLHQRHHPTPEAPLVERLVFLVRYLQRSCHHIDQQYDLGKLLASHSQWREISKGGTEILTQIDALSSPSSTATKLPERFSSETEHLCFYLQQVNKTAFKQLNRGTDQAIRRWIESSTYDTGT